MTRGVAAVLVLAGCPGGDTDAPVTPVPTDRVPAILALQGEVSEGSRVFSSNCVACHPADGSAGTGAALAEMVPLLSDEELATTILFGAPSMPDFGYLDDPEIADLMAFLRSEWP